MLAGLIFATEEAEDRPGTLAATLPFGGMTLLEYQIRLLVGAGAGHVLVAVQRVTPALLAAVSRAGRGGAPVDVVRSAEEAAACLHPLARVLVMADSLVTTDPVIDRMAGEGPEALLITVDSHSPAALERLDAQHCWAGLARVPAERLAEIGAMPEDYDFQSTLLRIVAQAGPLHVKLNLAALRQGHGVERNAAELASRSNAVLAALTERRTSWADRFVMTPIARRVLPWLVSRSVPAWSVELGAALLALIGGGAAASGWVASGLAGVALALMLFATGAAMRALLGQEARARADEAALGVAAAWGVLIAGWRASIADGDLTAMTLALVVIAAAGIAERVPVALRRWWASPAAYLLLLLPFAIAGAVPIGLGLLAIYAFSTLAAAVEASRQEP